MAEQKDIYLTQEGLDEIKKELDEFRFVGESIESRMSLRAPLNGAPQRRTAFVGRGEAKTQVAFFACEKCSIVSCASTK